MLKKSAIKTMLFVVICTLFVSACNNKSLTGTSYTRDEARGSMQIQKGVIVDIQQVSIEKEQTGIGAVAGSAIGAIAASGKDGAAERRILQVLAGIAGGVMGEFIERKSTTRDGYELVVDLNSGESISIVQQEDINMPFQVGDVVRIVERGNTVRVVRTRE